MVGPDDDIAIGAITAAELLLGVELADGGRRARRREFVEGLLGILVMEDYDLAVARAHAALMAEVRRSGRPRGAHDLIIAATAVSRDRIVITADESGFNGLPGVRARSFGRG